MAGSSLMDNLFQHTLEDLIKGLRNQLIGESAFISKSMDEIRLEIKCTDPHTKSTALQKLSYISSLYFSDMSWAAFHVVELMSSTRFVHKRIAYHAASLSFLESTPVLVLITNQLRKDLSNTNEFEVSLALECLSRIATVDLARDLTPEIFTLLASSKVFVRKKAIGVLLRVFEKYPDAVRVCFKRLVENLESSDPQAVSAAVGVFCELASKEPRSYLPLAPEFYRILVDSRNNWVLIKVLKIFAKLVPLEPRLAKRVVEPICDHMRRTEAKSLVFECIRTVVSSLTDYDSAVKLAVSNIREMLVDDDPNLKYLALHALSIVAPNHSWAVLENKEVVIKSLSDLDPNIKLESLHLVMAMVSESNVAEICRVLVNYALKSDPAFCNDILGSVLSTCSRNVYEVIVDFDWYVSLLGEMSRIPHCQKGEEIEKQLIDIGMRVKDVRPKLVQAARDLLIDPALLGNPSLHRILSAAAWVSGAYVDFSKNPFELIESLLQPRTNLLPPLIRAIYVQSVFKVLVFCLQSYFLQKENTLPTSCPEPENLTPGFPELVFESKTKEGSNLATDHASVYSKQEEQLNSRVLNHQSFDDHSAEHRETNIISGQGSTSIVKDLFTYESISNILNAIKLSLGPLSISHDVELLERSRNLLCFIEFIRQEIPDCLTHKQESLSRDESEATQFIELMNDAFINDLGPVSVHAQKRVPLPDDLVLKENLEDIEAICHDVQLPSFNSFSLGSSQHQESMGVSVLNIENKEESETSNESTLLLAEHRKRHGLYYLPSEKNEITSSHYPPANDLKHDDTENLVTLTEQSLAPKKKPNHAKPRPVVVKLDEGDQWTLAAKLQPKVDTISSAVLDVLIGSDTKPNLSQNKSSKASSSKEKGKDKLNIDYPSESKENLGDLEKDDGGNPSSRKSKHRKHRKERRHRSPRHVEDVKDEVIQQGKQKSRRGHGRHRTLQKSDVPLNVVPHRSVVPDFLL